ncbi:hypothetical protein D3C84_1108720 [compost metagenome]
MVFSLKTPPRVCFKMLLSIPASPLPTAYSWPLIELTTSCSVGFNDTAASAISNPVRIACPHWESFDLKLKYDMTRSVRVVSSG